MSGPAANRFQNGALMRKTERAQRADDTHAVRERRRAAACRIDRVMAERADAGDRAFGEQLERWKRERTGIRETPRQRGNTREDHETWAHQASTNRLSPR
jgi:hypothetical protein